MDINLTGQKLQTLMETDGERTMLSDKNYDLLNHTLIEREMDFQPLIEHKYDVKRIPS